MIGSGMGCVPHQPEAAPVGSPDLENGLAEFCERLADSKIALKLQ
jgi:hypothetical protein